MKRTCARLVKAWWSHGPQTTGGERLVQQTVASPDEGSAVEHKSGAGSATLGHPAVKSQIAPASPTTSGTQQEVAVEEGASVEGDRDEPNDTMDDVDNAPDPTPKRPRAPPPTRVLPDPRSEEFTLGSSGRLGTSCRHSKRCHERRVIQNPRQASTNSRRRRTTALKRSADTDDPPVRSQAHLHGTSGTQQRHQLQCQENGRNSGTCERTTREGRTSENRQDRAGGVTWFPDRRRAAGTVRDRCDCRTVARGILRR